MTTRVLIIDDEPDFVRILSDMLSDEGFGVQTAPDGVAGLRLAREARPDVILLDWNLPQKDGLQVCRELKRDEATRAIPVILLTARGRESDVVLGLEVGADDFVTKRALRPRELAARLRTVRRRASTEAPPVERWTSGDLVVDAAIRRVTVAGETVYLRAKEFDLLRALLERKGRVLSRAHLGEMVWGSAEYGASRTLDTTLAQLRAKLGSAGDKIQTIKNVGYQFLD